MGQGHCPFEVQGTVMIHGVEPLIRGTAEPNAYSRILGLGCGGLGFRGLGFRVIA